MRLWLVTTALLGTTFVGGQVYEFTTFYREGLAITTNLFGTTLLRAHRLPRRPRHGRHLHAAVARAGCRCADRLPDDPALPVEMVGLYWHFVDIVWIVIFTVVYLIPTGPSGSRSAHVTRDEQTSSETRRPRRRTHSAASESPEPEGVRADRLLLAALTAIEVALSTADDLGAWFIPVLLGWPSRSSCWW